MYLDIHTDALILFWTCKKITAHIYSPFHMSDGHRKKVFFSFRIPYWSIFNLKIDYDSAHCYEWDVLLYLSWLSYQVQILMSLSTLLNDIFTLFIFLAFLVPYDICCWISCSGTQNSLWLQCKYYLFFRIFLHAWWNTLFSNIPFLYRREIKIMSVFIMNIWLLLDEFNSLMLNI